MAYNNTQYIESLKVANLIFIPTNNQRVSTGYSLYINDAGQTYWAAGIDANSLSSFSTNVYNYINAKDSALSTSISSLQTQINAHSEQILLLYDQNIELSTYVSYEFSTLYESTIYIINSSIYGISSI